jgi:hypothetical protein
MWSVRRSCPAQSAGSISLEQGVIIVEGRILGLCNVRRACAAARSRSRREGGELR